MRRFVALWLASVAVLACTGPAGRDGKDGVEGPIGPQGPQGVQGPPGVAGIAGTPGPSAVNYTSPDGGVFSISTNAVFCGATSTTTGLFPTTLVPGIGNVSGYRAAKVLCELRCAANAAHMCTNEEVMRSAQLGVLPQGGIYWFAGGAYAYYSPQSAASNDCVGWTSNASTSFGADIIIDQSGPAGTIRVRPDTSNCNASYAIACCL